MIQASVGVDGDDTSGRAKYITPVPTVKTTTIIIPTKTTPDVSSHSAAFTRKAGEGSLAATRNTSTEMRNVSWTVVFAFATPLVRRDFPRASTQERSEEHTSELQSRGH